jgi:hypothetical protein
MAGALTIATPPREGEGRGRLFTAAWLVGACIVLLGISAAIPLLGFWVGDCGSRYLQMINIAQRHQFRGFSIDYPLKDQDPEFALRPFERQHTFVYRDRLYTQYPPTFAYVVGALYQVTGNSAMRIAPLAGALMLLLGTLRLGRRCGLRWPRAAAAVALFGSPLLPYAFTFWDILPALAAATWATAFLVQARETEGARWAAAAGLLAFLAFLLREEYLIWGGCLLLCLPWTTVAGRRVGAMFAGCFLFPVALTALANQAMIGEPLFMFSWSTSSDPSLRWSLGSRLQVLYNVLAMASYDPNIDIILFACMCGIVLIGSQSARLRAVACVGGLACALAVRWNNWHFGVPMLLAWMMNGAVTATPLFFVGLAPVPRSSRAHTPAGKSLLHVSLLFCVVFLLACPKVSSTGLHWGPRLLLPVYPLLIVRAFAVAEDLFAARAQAAGKLALAGFCALALLGFADSAVYLQRLRAKVTSAGEMLSFMRGTGTLPIVTELESAGMDLAPLFYERAVIGTHDRGNIPRALEIARELGDGKAVYLTERGLRRDVATSCTARELPLAQAASMYQRQFLAHAYELEWSK